MIKRPDSTSMPTAFDVWVGSVIVCGGLGFALVGAFSDEHLDCSNPELHESANTALGWTIAIVCSVLPPAVAVWAFRGFRRLLPAIALLVALGSLVLWQWILDADCEWYATGL